jgi:hypothetical protein
VAEWEYCIFRDLKVIVKTFYDFMEHILVRVKKRLVVSLILFFLRRSRGKMNNEEKVLNIKNACIDAHFIFFSYSCFVNYNPTELQFHEFLQVQPQQASVKQIEEN